MSSFARGSERFTTEQAQLFFNLLSDYNEVTKTTEAPPDIKDEARRLCKTIDEKTLKILSKTSADLASIFENSQTPSWRRNNP